jgi:hypothetical protein
MLKFPLALALGAFAVSQSHAIKAQSTFQPSVKSEAAPVDLADIPQLPRGKTTIFGGALRNYDPVRDQFTLDVRGQRPMRILFDERTKVFRDGSRIGLRELGPEAHASVETTLDGDKVFAVSIHILSQQAEGQYDGRVVSYNPSTGVLTIDASASRDPLRVVISSNTHFSRTGQREFASIASGPSDLAPGSLVSIRFRAQGPDQAVASSVSVLAVPGSQFSFSGNVASVDLHSGLLVLVDPNDQKTYQISFSSAHLQECRNLHVGDHVMVTATYSRIGFMASTISAN